MRCIGCVLNRVASFGVLAVLMVRTIQVVQDHTEDIGTISTTGARALLVQEVNEAMTARRYGST